MACPGWLPLFILLASHVIGLPKPDGEEARKVLGSSVVTSVSVIMDHGNGTKTYVSDGTTQPLPKPQRLVGSPADLMEPDRYEFYTFDETGDLVKRLMTLEEIQSLIAAGGDSEGIVGGPSMQPYYDQNLKTNSDQEQTLQTMETEQNSDMPGVYKVVQNVQNVLKGELAASQAKPLNHLPDLSMPDAASSWSILFPNVLDESLHSEINHLSEVLPEVDPNMKVPPSLKTTSTTSSYAPQRKPVTTTQSLKYTDRQPTTTDSSLIIHYLPINAVPSKNHNKKPSKPTGVSYDKYKPIKEATTLKTTHQEPSSTQPSSQVSTWSTLVEDPSSSTKQNLEAIKLNPQLADSFSNMLNQVTENPQSIIDDKYTKPSSAVTNKYGSTIKRNYTSIPLMTTMRIPNPVSTSASFENKYKNSTKQQLLKTKNPTENVKLNITKPVSTFGTTQYDRISTLSTRPFNTNNIQSVETKRPFQDATKQSTQSEYTGDFKTNGLQVQNLQQSSSFKTSPPVRTTPYNANNVNIQASSQKPIHEIPFKQSAEKLTAASSTNILADGYTKTYNPSQYVNNEPIMVTRPSSLNSIQPYTTIKPFTFFTTPDDTMFSEPFMSNASTQIYNPTLYINNQPILSTKPIQLVSPLRQSTTPMYYSITEAPQILSSQSYVSKPNPFLKNNFQTTPSTVKLSTNIVQITSDRNQNSALPSSFDTNDKLRTTTVKTYSEKVGLHANKEGLHKNVTDSNVNKDLVSNKPIKNSNEFPTSTEKQLISEHNRHETSDKLEQVKNANASAFTKTEISTQKIKVTNTINNISNKNKGQTNINLNKSTTNGQLVNQKVQNESKTNDPIPPKSNTIRPIGNSTVQYKQTNNSIKIKSNSTSEKYSNSSKASNNRDNTQLAKPQTTSPLTENSGKLGTTEINRDFSSPLGPNAIADIKTNLFQTTKSDKVEHGVTKKPILQSEIYNKKKVNGTGTVKVNNSTLTNKKPNLTTKVTNNSTRTTEILNKNNSTKTENVKHATKSPLNSQTKGSLKISQTTSPKPLSSTNYGTDQPSENDQLAEKINEEQIKSTALTQRPSWNMVSDSNNKISTPSESTVYIRVNTTTPEATSTERSSQTKITYTRYPESTSTKQTTNTRYPESTGIKETTKYHESSSTKQTSNTRYPESTGIKETTRYPESSSTKQTSNTRYPESTGIKETTRYPESSSTKQTSNTRYPESTIIKETTRYPESSSTKQTSNARYPESTGIKETTRYPESSSVKQSTKYPESSSIKQTTRYPESSSIKQTTRYPESSGTKQTTNTRYPESTSIKQTTKYPVSSTVKQSTQYPESSSVKQSTRYPESSSIKQTTRYPESTSIKQTTKDPEGTSIKHTIDSNTQESISRYPESTSSKQVTEKIYPESTSIKQTSIPSDSHLDNIVHDGISAVTSMLQNSSPAVTPTFQKTTSEGVTQETKSSVISDSFSNLTTENISDVNDKTETIDQSTTEVNYQEIKQNFDTKSDSNIATSSQITGSNISTVPVIGETKHASTEAMEQLMNDLMSVTIESTSSTPIESAALVRDDDKNSSKIESYVSGDDVTSISTEATEVTTAFSDDIDSQNIIEQTTVMPDKNLDTLVDLQITTQTPNDQEVETIQPLENSKSPEKLQSTLESATSSTDTNNESSTETIVEQNQNDDSTSVPVNNDASVTTDSTITADQPAVTTEYEQPEILSTAASTTVSILSELRTEAMELDIEVSQSVSSTTETLVIPEKNLNTTLATSTSTIQTTASALEDQIPNKPIFSVEDSKIGQDMKEPVENSKTASGGVAAKPSHQNQKPSTVELHPPPHEHMGLEASVAYLGDDIKRFADLCNELAFKMWTSLTGKGMVSSRSLVLSPFAVTSTLAMVFLGARGPTSGQMNDLLRLDDMVSFNPHQVLQNVTDSVIHAKRNGIDTAAFVRELYSDKAKGKILDFYKERVQQYYDGHVEEIGFNIIGDVLRRRTNLLVKRQTQGKVPEYLRGSTLSLKPPLAAFTANIFQTECERASTEGRDGEMYFVVRPSTRQRRLVPVPAAVWRTGFTAGYEPSLDATAVSLNHGSDNTISSLYVLPGQQGQVAPGDGLARLEQRLIETSYRRGGWSRLLRSLLRRPGLELQLPRFSHRSVLNVTATLQRMGLKDVFSAEKADLRGLNGIPNDLHLSDIIQVNTFSTCAEENIGARHHIETFPVSAQRVGREERFSAAAPDYSPRDPHEHLPLNLRPRQGRIPDAPRLRFDRPFLYLVRHNPTGMILYMGRFNPRLLA